MIMASAPLTPQSAAHPSSAPAARAAQERAFILPPRPRCPPVRRCCGLGPRPRPCARPAGSWRFVKISLSKCSASLWVKVALYTRGFHCSRFRGKRNRIRQVTGAHPPGRRFHGYRCDNVTLIAPCPRHGARLSSIGRGSAQASQEARAALREYDGRLPRAEAERLAWPCIQSARNV